MTTRRPARGRHALTAVQDPPAPAGRTGPPSAPPLRHRAVRQTGATLDVVARSLVRWQQDRLPVLARAYDTAVLLRRMHHTLGYRPDLRHPQTYNEKLAWRILHDRNPLIPLTTDKVAVRDYVAEKVGSDVLIPLIGVYERAVDIPWDELPRSFALKGAHGCMMNLIVHDKDALDRWEVLRTAEKWLHTNYYEESRERAYREIPRRLIIEELLTDEDGEVPADYKFMVFHGRVALIRLHTGRFGDHRVNFFDADLRPVAVRQVYPTAPGLELPPEVRDMVPLAETLAADFDYARIDLYHARGRAWFGEITHHDGNAHVWFRPPEFDAALGSLWTSPATAGPSPA